MPMPKLTLLSACLFAGAVSFFTVPSQAQIIASTEASGRKLFINDEPPVRVTFNAAKKSSIFATPVSFSLRLRLTRASRRVWIATESSNWCDRRQISIVWTRL